MNVATAPLAATAVPAPIAPAAQLNAAQAIAAATLPDMSSTTVELSRLGQFLSNVTLSRKRLAELQAAAARQVIEQTTPIDFSSVESVVQDLRDAFDMLQTNGLDADAWADDTLTEQLRQSLSGQARTENADTASDSFSLPRLGLAVQPSAEDAKTLLNLDTEALRSAFDTDPLATLSSLTQTADDFDRIAAAFTPRSPDPEPDTAEALETTAQRALRRVEADVAATPLQDAQLLAADSVARNTVADMALSDLLAEQAAPALTPVRADTDAAVAGAARETDAILEAAIPPADDPIAAQDHTNPRPKPLSPNATGAPAIAVQTNAEVLAARDSAAAVAAQAMTDSDIATHVTAARQTPAADRTEVPAQAAVAQALLQAADLRQAKDADTARIQAQDDADDADVNNIQREPGNRLASTSRQTGGTQPAPSPLATLAVPEATLTPAQRASVDAGQAQTLARDPAVAAAIAAYNMNQGPFRPATNTNQVPGTGIKSEVITPVQAVAPVARVGSIGGAVEGKGPRR